MLVLKRQTEEKVIIGNDPNCFVQVLEITHEGVKLGFNFPSEVPVHQKEVYDRIVADSDSSNSEE